MTHRFFLFFLLPFLMLSASAQNERKIQNDPNAAKLLEQVSTKFASYKSLETTFSMNINSPEDGLNETNTGKVWLKGQKYRIGTDDMDIICDNVKRWIHLKGDNEVQINFYEPDGDNIESPSQLFTMYKKGYYYRMLTDQVYKGKRHKVAELIPADVKKSSYKRIELFIEENTLQINKAIVQSADAVSYTWELTEFKPNVSIPDATFTFDAAKYPGIHVEDMTK